MKVINSPARNGRMGRHARWARQHWDDQIDFYRYETAKRFLDAGVPREVVFDEVARFWRGTNCSGSADTMRNAHDRVRRRLQTEPGRYYFSRRVAFSDDQPAPASSLEQVEQEAQALVDHLSNVTQTLFRSRAARRGLRTRRPR